MRMCPACGKGRRYAKCEFGVLYIGCAACGFRVGAPVHSPMLVCWAWDELVRPKPKRKTKARKAGRKTK